jgi:uncharacterized membrane protein YoaK (UPF0700 family)
MSQNISKSTNDYRERTESIAQSIQEYRGRPSLNLTNAPALHERNTEEQAVIIIGGSVLSFNAGWINAITFLECDVGSSHVTGNLALIGVSIATGENKQFVKLFFMVLCFLVGSIFTGMLIPYSSFHLGRQYNRALLLEVLFLTIGLIINSVAPKSIFFLFALSIACGVQNGITTKFSGNILRTTHHTGTITDIGIFIGRAIMGHYQDTWKLYVLCPLPISYAFGAAVATACYQKLNHISLIFNIIFLMLLVLGYTVVTFRSFNVKRRKAQEIESGQANNQEDKKSSKNVDHKNPLHNHGESSSQDSGRGDMTTTVDDQEDIVDAQERKLEEEESRKYNEVV